MGSKRRTELLTLFNYQLCPVLASINDEYRCLRKGNKSVIVQRLGILVSNPHPPDVVLVDALQLIYHVVWQLSGTVAETFVVFDRYEQVSAKDHERQRRAGESLPEHSVCLHAQLSRITAIVRLCYSIRQLQLSEYMPVRKSNYWLEHVRPWYDRWRCTHFN